MKNSNDTTWDRTSDLLICWAAPQRLCYRGPHMPSYEGLFFISDAKFVSHTTQEYKLMEVRYKYNGAERDIWTQEEGSNKRLEDTA